jgi:hypothetical protein
VPIQKFVTSEKNNITISDFVGEKDRLFFDNTTRTFRLSDGITPGGIVLFSGGGGGSYNDYSVDLHLNTSSANSGEVLSWTGTDYDWVAQPDVSSHIALTDLSVGTEGTASGDGAIAYDNATGVFTYTPPDLSDKITLTDLSIGVGAPPNGNGAIAYDNTIGVFYYTPPEIPDVTNKIELTDLSIGAEQPASGDGAISYDNTEGVFRYTPPVIPSDLTDLGIVDGSAGQVLTTDGSGNFTFTTVQQQGGGGGGGGISLTDLSVGTPNPASGAGAISYNGLTGVFKYTPPDTSSFLTSVAFSDLTSTPTTIAGYGITDAFDGDYNNLTNTPTIPADLSDLTDTTSLLFDETNPEFTESITIQSDESTNPVETEMAVFYGTSTGNSATRLYRDSSNSSIDVPAQTTVFFEADIVGRHDSSTDYGAFKIRGIIDRDGSNNTQMIMNQKETMHAGANELFDANIVADDTGELLAVEVYGESSKTIRWSALVKTTSVFQDLTTGGGDPQQNNWYGDRAWATGGNTGLTAGFGGYNNTVHLSIATQSNSTQTQGIFSYSSAVGFQASGVRGSTCLVVGGSDTGPNSIEDIRSFNCATLGASTSHGSLTNVFTNGEDGYMNNGSLSDGDRCVFQAGFDYQSSLTHLDTIGYVSIQNTGNASDFGNLSQARRGTTSSNDSTRGLFVGGEPSATTGSNRIDYVTIQTTGNATDFGDYTYSIRAPASASNNTITLVSGGRYQGSSSTMYITHCAYVTIQTPGNASTFGNLQNARRAHMMSSDGTYAVTWGGREAGTPGYADQSEYQVFATQGNATQFADIANYYLYEGGHGSGSSS